MKQKLLYLFILTFTSLAMHSQEERFADQRFDGLLKFTKSYFRSNPFSTNFSSFMNHLLNDPTIRDKYIQKRSDSTLYMFYGTYTTHNPFFFTPKRVEILLQEEPVQYGESVKVRDTIFTYQLLAYANDDAAGTADLKKEFEKINRQNNKRFVSNSYDEIKDGEEPKIEFYNYFISFFSLSPASVIRGRIKDQHEWVLNLTLRFKISANEAILVTPSYRP